MTPEDLETAPVAELQRRRAWWERLRRPLSPVSSFVWKRSRSGRYACWSSP